MAATVTPSSALRPRQVPREKPYAARVETATVISVTRAEIRKLLKAPRVT